MAGHRRCGTSAVADHKRRRRCHRHPASHSPGPPSPAPSKPDKMQTQTPQVNNPSPTVAPALLTRHSREVGNPWVAPGSLLRHAKSPAIPLGIVQSKQLRIQSTINQPPPHTPPPLTQLWHHNNLSPLFGKPSISQEHHPMPMVLEGITVIELATGQQGPWPAPSSPTWAPTS